MDRNDNAQAVEQLKAEGFNEFEIEAFVLWSRNHNCSLSEFITTNQVRLCFVDGKRMVSMAYNGVTATEELPEVPEHLRGSVDSLYVDDKSKQIKAEDIKWDEAYNIREPLVNVGVDFARCNARDSMTYARAAMVALGAIGASPPTVYNIREAHDPQHKGKTGKGQKVKPKTEKFNHKIEERFRLARQARLAAGQRKKKR